ncbi:helix-turn-helix domain-containing protein [Streptomyces phyllanthi]|nr:helix-turn-helix domain-containing protein [Streptomyces phyllanthi]
MLRDTITAWCENGFTLVRASAGLHIHRTTMALYLARLTDQLGGGQQAE